MNNTLTPLNGELRSGGNSSHQPSSVNSVAAVSVQKEDDTDEEFFNEPSSSISSATCKHHCKDKNACKHDCCKNGPKVTKKRKIKDTELVKSNVTKQLKVSLKL